MRRFTDILFFISIALFVGGVSIGLLGRALCSRSNDEHYKEIQAESFVPDVIETVLHDEELKQLYVCYNDANCVNVYTENGEFLWCVATPYLRISHFELQDDKLIICDGEAYIYDAKNGSFLGIDNEENLNLDYNQEAEYDEHYKVGSYYYDRFQVYKASANSELEVIINRPWWHTLFTFELCLSIGFIGAAGMGISIFSEKLYDYKAVKNTVVFQSKKAKIIKNYFRTTTIVHLVYTILNILLAFVTDWLMIGILPLCLHLIVSSIVLWNMKDRLSCQSDEMQVVDFWGTAEIGSFIIAFISVIIASAIAI